LHGAARHAVDAEVEDNERFGFAGRQWDERAGTDEQEHGGGWSPSSRAQRTQQAQAQQVQQAQVQAAQDAQRMQRAGREERAQQGQ
jgi:hypothetical protein